MTLLPDTAQNFAAPALPGNEFVDTQRRQLFTVQFPAAAAGAAVTTTLVNQRSTNGLDQQVLKLNGKVDRGGILPIEIKLPRDWPPGYYEMVIAAAGASEPLARFPYRVRAATPRVSPLTPSGDITIILFGADGAQKTVTTPKPSDRQIYFAQDTKGANTNGVTVDWTLTALATSAGNNINVGTITTADWPVENTRLAFDMELPRDWPTGSYKVDVKIDGKDFATKTFEIKP